MAASEVESITTPIKTKTVLKIMKQEVLMHPIYIANLSSLSIIMAKWRILECPESTLLYLS